MKVWLWLAGLLALTAALVLHKRNLPQSTVQRERAMEAPRGNAERGAALFARYECARCHGTSDDAALPERSRDCAGCHRSIHDGTFKPWTDAANGWQARIHHFLSVPSLTELKQRVRRDWFVNYLQRPVDLRPHLPETMPRLAIDAEQALDLAAYFGLEEAPVAALHGNATRGREAFFSERCRDCHEFSGAETPSLEGQPWELPASRALAPDLAFTRRRWQPDALERWLTRTDHFSSAAHSDIVAYVFSAPLAPPSPRPAPRRLPPLQREVSFAEVSTRIFRKTCWHCHSNPEYAIGDGGPGNTGGFGFAGKGVDLSDHPSVLSGYLDARGERRSLVAPGPSGVPRLLEVLLARQGEETSGASSALRGMPLALPALAPEDIQLVESWLEQGAPE